MKNKKKLSIVITARNDNYVENFLNRLEFSINYFLYNAEKLKLITNLEFIVVDWGSKKKLSEEFRVIKKKYINNIFFLELSENEAYKHSKNILGNFFTEKANNLGIIKSSGSHVMLCHHDTIFSKSSIRNIFSFIYDEVINKDFVWIPRKYMHYQFYKTNPSFNNLDKYFTRNFSSKIRFENIKFHNGAGASAILFSKKNFIISGCLDQEATTKGYFSGSDVDLLKRISVKFNHLDGTNFGIYGLKLPRLQLSGKKINYINKLSKKNYGFVYSKDTNKKSISTNIKFNIKKCKNIVQKIKIISSKNNYIYLNIKDIVRIFWHTIYSVGKLSNFVILFKILKLLENLSISTYIDLGTNYSSRIPYISKIFPSINLYSLNLQRTNSNNFKTQFYLKLNRYLNRTQDGYYRFIYSSDIKNINNFFLKEELFKNSNFLNFNLQDFTEKEIFKLLKIIKRKSYNFAAILFENTSNIQKILNYIVLDKRFSKNFFIINICENFFILINNKTENLDNIKKSLLTSNIPLNLIFYLISYVIYFLAILKKYFYFFKGKIKLF